MATLITAQEIIDVLTITSPDDVALIRRAYDYAAKAHEGRTRYSGDSYLTHLASVAKMLAEIGMGAPTVAAGLLHDSIEDTNVTPEELKAEFGEEIFFLVQGVTKLGSVRYYGSDRHNESLRKLFVATSQDIRVLIIKLLDRLHNMQTLQYVPQEKQLRIARETLEIYVPVTHRLGMGRIRKELEDLAFPYVYPEEHKRVLDVTKHIAKSSEVDLERARKALQKRLAESGIRDFHTSFRSKGLYSLFQKLKRREWDMDRVYDYLAIRVVVPTIEECYQVLGIVHEVWRPLPQRVKDYIAFPKPNGYKSLHTTVITPNRTIVEVQIRTEAMHREAEYGIASHIIYKNRQLGQKESGGTAAWFASLVPALFKPFIWKSKAAPDAQKEVLTDKDHKLKIPRWIQEIADTHKTSDSEREFFDGHRDDFFSYRIFVFTPEGDVIDLPVGASPIDFAYAIHSDIGDHVAGAKVNNKLTELSTELNNGDIVEIITGKANKPTRKWLNYSKTSLARRKIRAALAEQNPIVKSS
ncbi:bifunctional (p)ppGpp synthetase/guanosine-3',5'-bis(diphosphate) 3'-pyrophosphohydrolase [Candidatus Kaiserbacteria bacterium]|nr:MAG: bifunctional (p)ppGpp synthetase/guanosine-3',5'-bis(diphosphate) 3'-pyrophosphohydrolase [Candidatus Kaiserbacteria bacterium]